jgi:tRNA-modifying protein YgfZ
MTHAVTPAAEGPALYPATGLSVVAIEGPDATSFLDAQSTVGLAGIGDGVTLGALADAQGRVLLVFRAWRHDDGWRLLVPAGEAEWLHGYLSRFVFRARVTIVIEKAWRILGIAGSNAPGALEHAGIAVPAAGHSTVNDSFATLGLAHARWLLCGEAERMNARTAPLSERCSAEGEDAWRRLRLAAREPEIREPTRARFLPQMLGLVELGAVGFDKGCYPGQEVIARTQHRGRVKRRMALFDWAEPPPPAGATVEVDRRAVEALDGTPSSGGRYWLQAVVPWPTDGELARRLVKPGSA